MNLKLILHIVIINLMITLNSQSLSLGEKPSIDLKDGIAIKKDSSFLMNFRFRVQTRIGFNTMGFNELSTKEVEGRIRRMRLRFDGFVLSKKLTYYIQLSVSRADMDLQNATLSSGGFANVVRDAIVTYAFNHNFSMSIGQTKLPGNRERVISSGNLQFPDRSIVNDKMTIDRDNGLWFNYTKIIKKDGPVFNARASLSMGEGRGTITSKNGMAYTGRIEILPFGAFHDKGDYFEGDLFQEPKPKLSIGANYQHNYNTTRVGGQLGSEFYNNEYKDIQSLHIDMMFKYKGLGLMVEYMKRNTPDPSPISKKAGSKDVSIFVGNGINTQLSKMISKKNEIAFRYAVVNPLASIKYLEPKRESALLCFNHYFNHHKIKFQHMLGLNWEEGKYNVTGKSSWVAMFQVEFGI